MLFKAIFYCWLGALLTVPLFAGSVSLAWDPSASSGVTGYRVYYGNSSRKYITFESIGIASTYTVLGLTPGVWFFAVTAYDGNGNESDYSNEVSTIVPSATNRCDVNSDGAVNALDLQIVSKSILNRTNIGDINGDGKVDAIDLQLLSGVILRRTTCPK